MFKQLYILLLFPIITISCRKDNVKILNKAKTNFLVVGHAYGNPIRFKLQLYENLLAPLNIYNKLLLPNKVVFTGDIVAKSNQENWTNVVNQLDSINVDYWIAPGNHDIGSNYLQENIQENLFFTERIDNNLIFVLNTNFRGWTISEEQIIMIEDALKKVENVNNILVFTHHVWWANTNYRPIYFDTIETNANYGLGDSSNSNFWTDAFPLFENIELPIYFYSGDVGALKQRPSYYEDHYENYHFYASGVGGGIADNFLSLNIDVAGNLTTTKINF